MWTMCEMIIFLYTVGNQFLNSLAKYTVVTTDRKGDNFLKFKVCRILLKLLRRKRFFFYFLAELLLIALLFKWKYFVCKSHDFSKYSHNNALNYCVQKWDKCIKHLGSRLFMFRTWIVRQHNPVWVHKLTDIVTSLDSELVSCPKSDSM